MPPQQWHAQRASATSVDCGSTGSQCPTWALTLTGDWIKSGAEDGFWLCMKVYGSLRVWRVWCVWCVWCDWCVLTRTLLWQYGYVLGCTAWLYVGRLTWGLQYFPEGLKVCIDLQISKTEKGQGCFSCFWANPRHALATPACFTLPLWRTSMPPQQWHAPPQEPQQPPWIPCGSTGSGAVQPEPNYSNRPAQWCLGAKAIVWWSQKWPSWGWLMDADGLDMFRPPISSKKKWWWWMVNDLV